MKNKMNMAAGQKNPTPEKEKTRLTQPGNTPNVGKSDHKFSWWTETPLSGRVLLPLRLFLGITFVYAGIQKLTDPQFFNPRAAGYIGKQIMGIANGSPIHNFLLHIALPHAA